MRAHHLDAGVLGEHDVQHLAANPGADVRFEPLGEDRPLVSDLAKQVEGGIGPHPVLVDLDVEQRMGARPAQHRDERNPRLLRGGELRVELHRLGHREDDAVHAALNQVLDLLGMGRQGAVGVQHRRVPAALAGGGLDSVGHPGMGLRGHLECDDAELECVGRKGERQCHGGQDDLANHAANHACLLVSMTVIWKTRPSSAHSPRH